jgi:4-alpha-glucanotransferase
LKTIHLPNRDEPGKPSFDPGNRVFDPPKRIFEPAKLRSPQPDTVINVHLPRSSGILLHPTSLPGRFGIGDLGPAAYSWVDWLHAAAQSLWQVLPLGPTGYGDSPYQLFSAFAGNPLLISPKRLRDAGLLSTADLNAYPQLPASEQTAVNGQWKTAPGEELFHAARTALGDLPIVAENLGVITPEVEAIRNEFGFPGMAILQFAFGKDPQAPTFKPHNYPRRVFAYTGTHDNDTIMGWWNSKGGDSTRSAEDIDKEKATAEAYLGIDDLNPKPDINWVMMRSLLQSPADSAIMPLQDVLGLGSESRFNTPGKLGNNWRWRYLADQLTPTIAQRLNQFVALYDREGIAS